MANAVFDTVRTVLAVREYQDRPVPRDVLRRVVEAGHLAASASNRQPWHFVLVEDKKTLRELAGLVRTGPYIGNAAAAIVVALDKETPKVEADGSRAIEDMILTAWAEGVGSNWTGFGGLDGVRERVGLPERWDVFAVLPLGYPKRKIGLGRKKRKLFDEVVSSERYGTPLR